MVGRLQQNELSNPINKREITLEIIKHLFIILFIYAAISKLLDVQKFEVQIGKSPMLTGMAPFIAWFIPAIEILISLLLAFRSSRLLGFYSAFTLMVMFTTYIIIIITQSQDIPCSCGGVLQSLGWTEHLIFNIAFILLGGLAIVLQSAKESPKER